jgi:type IV pilus assembly protein PilO
MRKTSAFANFIDTKFLPMAPKAKLAIVAALVLLPAVAFYFAFYSPKKENITALETTKTNLQRELQEVKKKAANLARFERELEEAEEKFLAAAVLLPKEKEIPQLLRDISALGRTAGLDFNVFKPLPDVPKDFYAEIPISIKVRGPYHNMGFFFDKVSKLERIVSVTNVKMSSPQKDAGEMLLNSDCRLLTYRFTNVELPKPDEKK